MSLGLIYIGLLGLGVLYALAATVMGWFSDIGGDDITIDAGGHFDVGHAHPVSGTTVATFITGFGGGGIVGHFVLDRPTLESLLIATVSGFALSAAAYGVLSIVFRHTQAGGEFHLGDLAGSEAEVTLGIPAGGTGQVAILVKGQRELASARASDGTAIPKNHGVVIERVVGSTLYVKPRVD
jgi:hypothetical protein